MPIFNSNYNTQQGLVHIDKFEGIDKSVSESKISLYCSPDELNCRLDEQLTIDKRLGYKRIYDTSLGAGKINGLFQYRKSDGTTELLMAHTTKLYKLIDGEQPTQVYDGLTNSKVKAFQMGGFLYLLDGTNYLRYDGTNVTDVTTSAYVPTLTMGRAPTGGGNAFEQFNLLGKAFKDSFSTTKTDTVYQLSLTNLDATTVKAWFKGTEKVEVTDFTVDRVNGKVTFKTAFNEDGNPDNLIIQAEKTITSYADRIKKCTECIIYGGENDTRVILSGNPDSKSVVFRSGLLDPTYYPDNDYEGVGNNDSAVQGFALQYDLNIVLKEDSLFVMDCINDNGAVRYPVRPLNDRDGCCSRNSVQLIKNMLTYLNKNRGVCVLNQSSIRSEMNVIDVSDKVKTDLLKEANIENALSADYDGKFILVCPSGKAYVWYYNYADSEGKPVWTVWDNIKASCFCEYDNYLYFGSDTEGIVYRFYKADEAQKYNDDGAAINQYIYTKLYDYGMGNKYKNIPKVNYTLKPETRASCALSYGTEDTAIEEIQADSVDLFDYRDINYKRFSYVTNRVPKTVPTKPKIKKIMFTKFKFENNVLNEGMGISSIDITYNIGGDVK